ncbi:MAG: 5-(carboxyamino)imidazole ribonucleotide synthase [Rickettsiales bacterium]|nr:5-(carboxyamino)imidazole ribonucleotide synthase [Rickettsiales bacterium]
MVNDKTVITPGSTIGILGGGQLGRMLVNAASELGYKTHIYCPEEGSPAFEVATEYTVASYEDTLALRDFLQKVDVVTFEFENIPHESLKLLEESVAVRPSPDLLKISQNRLREKNFINAHEIPTANYHRVASAEEMDRAIERVGVPAILKTTELGYDGKGQVRIETEDAAQAAWDALGHVECVLETVIDFEMEISVIVSRGLNGQQASFSPVENIHKNHILDKTIAPANLSKPLSKKAQKYALTLAKAADLRGLLAVEMFVTRKGEVLINELAPRPHNSGHWTMDACVTGQFEQHIRAVCNLPLGGTERICDAVMHNLIGDQVNDWQDHIKNPHAKVHLYGKKEARAGRKMGHVTILKA